MICLAFPGGSQVRGAVGSVMVWWALHQLLLLAAHGGGNGTAGTTASQGSPGPPAWALAAMGVLGYGVSALLDHRAEQWGKRSTCAKCNTSVCSGQAPPKKAFAERFVFLL